MTVSGPNGYRAHYDKTAHLPTYEKQVKKERWPILHEEKALAPVAEGTDMTFARTSVFEGVGKSGHETRVSTTVFLDFVVGKSTTLGGCMGLFPLAPSALGGFTELMAQGYQASRFRTATLHYVPSCPTDTTGQILVTYYDDPAAYTGGSAALGSGGLNDSVSTNQSAAITVWSAHSLTPTLNNNQKSYMTADGGDARLETQGLFVVQQVAGITSGVTYGTLWLEVEADFRMPRLNRTIAFPITDGMTITWTAAVVASSAPMYFNSTGGQVGWTLTGAFGPISATDPTYIYCGYVTAVTATPPDYYTEDDGATSSFSVGAPFFLRSERVAGQQTLTIFKTYEACLNWSDDTAVAGTLPPGQLGNAVAGTYSGSLGLVVRRIPYNND